MVFHTLYRGQRDTRLYPLLVSFSTLYFLFRFPIPGVFLSSPYQSSPPSTSANAPAASCAPTRSITACSHHNIPTRAPGSLSDPSHMSNNYRVEIYCATVLWRHLTYYSIAKKPAASLDIAVKLYFHVLSVILRMSCPVSRLATWV